jgi:hypothetical protein
MTYLLQPFILYSQPNPAFKIIHILMYAGFFKKKGIKAEAFLPLFLKVKSCVTIIKSR